MWNPHVLILIWILNWNPNNLDKCFHFNLNFKLKSKMFSFQIEFQTETQLAKCHALSCEHCRHWPCWILCFEDGTGKQQVQACYCRSGQHSPRWKWHFGAWCLSPRSNLGWAAQWQTSRSLGKLPWHRQEQVKKMCCVVLAGPLHIRPHH